jgi:hypothetical protein
MATELPAQSIVAIATVIASLIAGVFSFVNLTLNKEQKTSEFRQAWIDGLRADLAAFFAAARAFARAIEFANKSAPDSKEEPLLPISGQKIGDLRHEAAETYYRIKLRLNPDEVEHIELLRLLEGAVAEQNKMQSEKTNAEKTLNAIELAADYARPVLKAEWRRVKSGELPFRIARNWVAPIVVALCIAFVVFVWTGTFKI